MSSPTTRSSRGRLASAYGWVVVAAALLLSSKAAAGAVELLDGVKLAPSDPNTLLLYYRKAGGGMFVSHDGGKSFAMLCNSAIDPSLALHEDSIARVVRDDKTILAGVFDGMWRGDAEACGFVRDAAFTGQWVNGFAIDPHDPTRTYAITSAGGKPNGVFVNDGKSEHWSKLGKLEDLLITTLHVVATSKTGVRIYETVVRGYDVPVPVGGRPQPPTYVIRFSDDLGKTWTEYAFGMTDATIGVLAVDPTDATHIVVGALRDEVLSDGTTAPDDLLYSSAAGKPGSFKTIGHVTELGGITFAPDGRLFYGDREQTTPALYAVAKLGATAKKISSDYKVQCVSYDAQTDKLYVCQDRLFGTADPATGAFSLLFDVTKEDKLVSCGAGSDISAMCEDQFLMGWCGITHYPTTPICEPYGVPGAMFGDAGVDAGAKPAADGGMRDGGTGRGKIKPSSGCACAQPGADHASSAALAPFGFLLGLSALVVSRRRRSIARTMTRDE